MDISEKRKIIQGAKEWVDYNLPIALKLMNNSYCKILILSTIESFAQMWGNYPKNRSNETFCNFVLKYSSQKDILQKVCPVTLHYHYANNIEIKLEQYIYNWDDEVLAIEADRMLNSIPEDNKRAIAEKKHSYIKLLYSLRSKLVHELNNLGTPIEFSEDIPSVASGMDIDGNIIWSLNYPRQWLYNLAIETIYNFVNDCLENEKMLRFLDNPRRTKLTWYD